MNVDRVPALDRLVGDVGRFATDHWGRRPLVRRSGGHFDDLLDVAAVERLLVDLGRTPTFRLVREGRRLPASDYTLRTRVGGVSIDDVADVDRILDEVAHGATVVLQGLQRFWPPLTELCLELERSVGHAVQANAYLTPPGAAGLAEHADEHDVLVLHVAGAKRWEVEGLGTVALDPGDVMYVPARARHAAHTLDVFSLHLTVGFLTTTYRDVLRRVVDGLADEQLDRPLPLGFLEGVGRERFVSETADMLATAVELLAKQAHHQISEAEIRRRQRRARRRQFGRLGVVLAPASIGTDSYVRRSSEDPIAVIDDGTDTVVLETPTRRLRLPSQAGPALHVVADRVRFRVDDLQGLEADERLVLVRRLIREGILALVQEPSTSAGRGEG